MTKIRFMHLKTLENLHSNIEGNLDRYRNGEFKKLLADDSCWFEIEQETNEKKVNQIKLPKDDNYYEVDNCIAVHEFLPNLAPSHAKEERLWAYLAHTTFFEYARHRWPIPDDNEKAVSHIESHFFAGSDREFERDNAISRLWWMAYLCNRIEGVNLEEALQALLFRADVRANLIERPTVAQSTPLFSAVVKKLIESQNGDKRLFDRPVFREMMREINSIGGAKLLDCLTVPQAEKMLGDIIRTLQ